MVGLADPETEHAGAADTAELQETPGPDTVQVALAPFTFDAFQERLTDWPARTRFGVAVMERFADPAVQ